MSSRKTRRAVRPYVRKGLMNAGEGAPRGGAAARLMAAAGEGRGSAKATVDALEPRKLLFTLTIGPDDVGPDGIGFKSAYFGYTIPYLFRSFPDPVDPEPVEEEFEDENAPWTENVPAIPPNGFFFEQSNIQISYSSSGALIQRIAGPDDDLEDDFDMQVTLSGQGFVTWSFFTEGSGDAPPIPRGTRTAAFVIRGLDTTATGTKVELLSGGQVVATFEGPVLAGIGTPVVGGNIRYEFNSPVLFDAVRFSSAQPAPDNQTYFDQFVVDDITITFPTARFAEFVAGRIFGVEVAFRGPVGASVQILDLYGRDMVQTIALGIPNGSQLPIVDMDGDGVPNFNDGIGQIIFRNTDASTSFTMYGGEIIVGSPTFPRTRWAEGGFVFNLIDDIMGLYDSFEEAGFGYRLTADTPPQVVGLPPGQGSIIVGSPVVRSIASPEDYFGRLVSFDEQMFSGTVDVFAGGQEIRNDAAFRRPDQGVRVEGGASIGSVVIHGILHGSSRFTGAVQRLGVGLLLGSVTIDGDAGYIAVASDSGHWVGDDQRAADPGVDSPDSLRDVRNEIVVGRTLGEYLAGGRSTTDVTVIGDINNPGRAVLSRLDYIEREQVAALDDDLTTGQPVETIIQNLAYSIFGIFSADEQVPFGEAYYRNDTIGSAEFISTGTSAVNLRGFLGRQDPVNTAADSTDVYAFTAAQGEVVTFDIAFDFSASEFDPQFGFESLAYARIVDADGRPLAAHEDSAFSPQRTGEAAGVRMTFRPDYTGVFYLVLNTPVEGAFQDRLVDYRVRITGMMPVAFGGHRSGAATGYTSAPTSVVLQSGNMGLVRVGTGYVAGNGEEVAPTDLINTVDDEDDLLSLKTSNFNVAGTLYGVWLGSDAHETRLVGGPLTPGPQFVIGGNLGTFHTGRSPIIGIGPEQGDVEALRLEVGGSIGVIDIGGAVRFDQDTGQFVPRDQPVTIRTGTAGGPGHIGVLRVGQSINGEDFNVITSPGSVINAFLVGEDGGSGEIDEINPNFQLGAGSDLRFASFSRIESLSNPDAFRPLTANTPVVLTDDAGGVVTIEIRGGSAASSGQVRVLPINGSVGVAIARIDANLLGGASLVINGQTANGRVSIGRIVLTTDTATSTVQIGGSGEIDVLRLDQTDGPALALIQNQTVGGDIVAIDVQGLTELQIRAGSLGRTQVTGIGPRLLGPFLNIASGAQEDVGAPLGVDPAAINPGWNGQAFEIVNPRTSNPGSDITLADAGGPFDPWLNGMVVRSGDVQQVLVAGAVGDVILQSGSLGQLRANSDGGTAPGGFDGIVGSIYAADIGIVHVGDGLAGPGQSSLAAAGIFATGDIGEVIARDGAVIGGLIIAANLDGDDPGTNNDGVVRVRAENARYDSAYIGGATFDSWWMSARFFRTTVDADDPISLADVVFVTGSNSDFFRSEVFAQNVIEVGFTNGVYDASLVDATGSVFRVYADQFRNSTRLGEVVEFRRNEIRAALDIREIFTNGFAGDITDLRVDAQGNLTGGVTARNLVRSEFDVDGTIRSLVARDDIRAVTVRSGGLEEVRTTGDIRSTSMRVAGPIGRITAGGSITSVDIVADGPDGSIDRITSTFFLTGSISSSGQINQIVSTMGDIIATIKTTDVDGNLVLLQAAGDVRVTLDISSHVDRIIAGRNIGAMGDEGTGRAINVRGNLNIVQALGGQIYTDINVGQGLNIVSNARVAALPGYDLVSRATIRAFGRINTVNIFGDFNGSIISESGGIGTVTITDGSFRPGGFRLGPDGHNRPINSIIARDGGIGGVTIIGGHLMGNIIADEDIGFVRVLPNSVGFWGDIGINPHLSASIPFDSLRNQLPPGVAPTPLFDGPRIQSGTNIGEVVVANASMWESSIYAGHSIGRVFVYGVIVNDTITPGLGGSWIAAGDTIARVEVNQFVGGAFILAGITDLGADDRPGGTGANTDTVQFGRIGDIILRGGTGMVSIAAGLNAGPDGFYTLNPGPDGIRGTADDINDDAVADGISSIGSVTVLGAALQTTVYADNGIGFTSPEIIRGGPGLKQQNPGRIIEFVPTAGQIMPGVATPFVLPSGETGTITFTGPGLAFYEQVFDPTLGRTIGRLAIINSTFGSQLIVTADQGTLTDLRITSNDGASISYASVRGNLRGASSFYFDAYVEYAEFGALDTTGVIGAGNDFGTLIVGPTVRGRITANYINLLGVGGTFGNPNDVQASSIDLLAGGTLHIGGDLSGVVTLKRDAAALNVAGAINRGNVRSGRGLSEVNAASMNFARITARNDVARINIAGDVVDSLIYAGTDLGTDGAFGGTGTAADVVTDGNILQVRIGGNFIRSDLAAGVSRGPDGFLGTADDLRDEGRSSIGVVDIRGQVIGSELNSQSYRITATGSIGQVRAGGAPFTGVGNVAVQSFDSSPDPLQVVDLTVTEFSRVYTANITFNQPVNAATIAPALRVSEVRAGGEVVIALAEGTDYTVEYDPATLTARVVFNPAVTARDLPLTPGLPGPGLYRFTLDSAIIRGQTQNTLIDGDGDGFAFPGDTWSEDTFVGDVGDKLGNSSVTLPNGNVVDFYAAGDLNLAMDNNRFADGLPDVNKVFTVRGTIGDHPDSDVDFFRFAGDADVYRITLRAGQFLRLGAMQGNAALANRAILNANGQVLFDSERGVQTGTDALVAIRVSNNVGGRDAVSTEDQFLIRETGTYYIAITATQRANLLSSNGLEVVANPANLQQVANIPPIAGATGAYSFTVEVFDDFDSGFSGDTDSGDGVPVVPAPTPIAFAGADGVFGTGDDLPVIVIGNYTFGLSVGADGVPNTADDFVSGTNHAGITSQRTAGPDGVFGTVDDVQTSFIGASIGPATGVGVPREVTPDVDVYHLNNREPIAPGTRIRATLRLTEFGSNLGLSQQPRPEEDLLRVQDLRGEFQFAIFETSTSTTISDALVVASPSDAKPVGGQSPFQLSNGASTYGYDAEGNFFIEFVVPGRQGINGVVPASYALYIQGAVRSDYEVVIQTAGAGSLATPTPQNVFIETNGGVIDWLEAGGVTTTLAPFSVTGLGFSGVIDGQPVNSYVISRLISNLNDMFAAANVAINVSTNVGQFQGQDFSTVFLTRTAEPTAFAFNGFYGQSEHVDAFNLDRNDQAVVFSPSLQSLGFSPDRAGVDAFIQSLTASVARRIGELVGLRPIANAQASNVVPVMSSNSPTIVAPTYRFNTGSARLSNNWDALFDANFYLGQQNDVALLDRILADRF